MPIKITALQGEIIARVSINSKEPAKRLAKQLGIQERSLRYQLQRLTERGLIKEAPFLNIYPLGLRYVNLYFSLASSQSANVERFVAALRTHPRVAWLAELGADYHYGVSLVVKELDELKDILNGLSRRFPALLFEKSFVFHLALEVFPAKYLAGGQFEFPVLGYGRTGQSFEADALDRKLLSTMAQSFETSGRALARRLGHPHATVEVRLRRMEKANVIAGYWYLFNAASIGYQTLKLLIYAKGHQAELSSKLLTFARRHPNISYYIECVLPHREMEF
jgi:DNA-binding Lrp family transcriptional regulator